MKRFKILLFALALTSVVTGNAFCQDTLYYEYFTDGSLTLDWFSPWEGGDNMEVDYWENNPSGDHWVGFVGNQLSGGGVGTTLSGDLNLTDYEMESQIFTRVVSGTATGPYTGIVVRCDTVLGLKYYSFRSDFDNNRRLQLRKFPGASGYGESIAEWSGDQIPNGVPTQDSWHLMKVKCEGNQIYAYWDGILLSGCPYSDNDCSRGFFGIYGFYMTGTLNTYCDDILVMGEAGPQPFDLVTTDYDILDSNMQPMILRPAVGQTIYFSLDWEAINGSGTSSAFNIGFFLDTLNFYNFTHPGVTPNTAYTTTTNSWTATLGEHIIRWELDTGNTVPEGNENNNTIIDTILVLPVTAYDLQADSSWVADSDTNAFEESPVVGDEVLFVLFWSAPMGQGSSGAFNITMDLDGSQYYLNTVFFAVSGQDYTAVTDPWTATLGFHYYTWEVDADNWIDEFNEYNNSILDGFNVVEGGGVGDIGETGFIPVTSRISDVFPNPFNPAVTLRYEIANPGMVTLAIYDIQGKEVVKLFEGFSAMGIKEITWEAQNIASGNYFAVMEAGGERSVKRLLLIK